MSRSYKKHPGGGITTAKSDKPGRKSDHRRYRHYANQKVRQGEEEIEPPNFKENVWNWPKDGKQYWPEGEKDFRWMGK